LKRTRSDFWDKGDCIDYDDTDATSRLRTEMREVNSWLADADIECDAEADDGTPVDVCDRLLRRYFNNGCFKDGGRLFGGFWQPMKKEARHATIRIDGERVITLDYDQ